VPYIVLNNKRSDTVNIGVARTCSLWGTRWGWRTVCHNYDRVLSWGTKLKPKDQYSI